MKTKIATALSVVGVLGAGSAAALVNTQILDDGAEESGASAAVLPPASSVDVTIPEITIPDDDDSMGDDDVSESTVPESSVPESTAPTTEPPADSTVPETTVPAPSEFLTAFNVGEAARR